MAKLNNVKVTASQIEVNGIKFTQTDDEAAKGDIIRITNNDDKSYVVEDGCYEVVRIDRAGDPQFIDEDGDELDGGNYEHVVFKKTSVTSSRTARLSVGDFAKVVEDDESDLPFRCTFADGRTISDDWFGPDELERVEAPAATVTTTPTSASEIVTHKGVQYRKVARQAAIGELVVLVSRIGAPTHYFHNVPVVVKVIEIRDGGKVYVRGVCERGDEIEQIVAMDDYRVLEPLTMSQTVKTSPTALPDAYIVHNGKVYVKEARKAVKGELVVITDKRWGYDAGDITTINVVDPDDDTVKGALFPDVWMSPKRYNVLVPTDSVTIDGVEYTLERRDAKRGENVVITLGDGHFINIGQIVEATSRLSVTAKVTQFHDGRRSGGEQVGMDGQYVVLTPKAAKTPEPSYREFSRKANVGDRIRIVNADCTFGDYGNGDVMTAVDIESGGVHTDKQANGWPRGIYVTHDEYVVLETITAPERLKVGDYAKVIGNSHKSCFGGKDGEVVEITRVVGSGSYRCRRLDGYEYDGNPYANDGEIVRATDAEVTEAKRKLTIASVKVGDYVKITQSQSNWPVGTIVKVTNISGGTATAVGNGNSFLTNKYVPATPEEIAAATPPTAKPSPTFKVGDTVKLTIADGNYPSCGYGNVKNGDVGVIRRINGDGVVVNFPAQSSWYGLLTEFTPASAEDVKAAEESAKEREIAAKYTAIGREKGEIKVGDVVRSLGHTVNAPKGTLGIAEYGHDFAIPCMGFRDSTGTLWSASNGRGLELVAPVESLFTK